MDELTFIWHKSNLSALIYSLDASIQEVKEKRPNALDYIEGMDKHKQNLIELLPFIESMKNNIGVLNKLNFNYHKENMELRFENERLKTQVEHLMHGL